MASSRGAALASTGRGRYQQTRTTIFLSGWDMPNCVKTIERSQRRRRQRDADLDVLPGIVMEASAGPVGTVFAEVSI